MSAIRTTALRRTFGATVAVDALDLDVAEGEIFGLAVDDVIGSKRSLPMLMHTFRTSRDVR